jgi:hypothetical protein
MQHLAIRFPSLIIHLPPLRLEQPCHQHLGAMRILGERICCNTCNTPPASSSSYAACTVGQHSCRKDLLGPSFLVRRNIGGV